MKSRKHWILSAMLAACALPAVAQTAGRTPPPGPPRRPPQPAIDACKGKALQAKVKFPGRHGEQISGTCKKMGDVMAAVPDSASLPPPPPPPPPPAGPPPRK